MTSTCARKEPEKVIIDSDPGVDDFFALLLALASAEHLEVLGITIVAGGNGKDVRKLARNACSAVHLCGKSHAIKVVEGASVCLTGVDRGGEGLQVHGPLNGLGDIVLPDHACSEQPLQHACHSAARFLVETCEAVPGEVTLITLGPLTNVAEALRLSPSFAGNVRRVVMMGGAAAGGGQWREFGNKAATAEANVHNDPEAAKLVFASISDITMAGLNVTHQLDMCVLRERLLAEAGEAGRLCHAISDHYVTLLKSWGNEHIGVHDPTAVLALTRPDLFEAVHVCVDVETRGELTAGQTVVDWKGHWGRKPQTKLLLTVNAEIAHDEIVRRIASLNQFPNLGELVKGTSQR